MEYLNPALIRSQVEYYFSQANLPTDIFLQFLMEPGSLWTPIEKILPFRRMKAMGVDGIGTVAVALLHSAIVEVDRTGYFIRPRVDPSAHLVTYHPVVSPPVFRSSNTAPIVLPVSGATHMETFQRMHGAHMNSEMETTIGMGGSNFDLPADGHLHSGEFQGRLKTTSNKPQFDTVIQPGAVCDGVSENMQPHSGKSLMMGDEPPHARVPVSVDMTSQATVSNPSIASGILNGMEDTALRSLANAMAMVPIIGEVKGTAIPDSNVQNRTYRDEGPYVAPRMCNFEKDSSQLAPDMQDTVDHVNTIPNKAEGKAEGKAEDFIECNHMEDGITFQSANAMISHAEDRDSCDITLDVSATSPPDRLYEDNFGRQMWEGNRASSHSMSSLEGVRRDGEPAPSEMSKETITDGRKSLKKKGKRNNTWKKVGRVEWSDTDRDRYLEGGVENGGGTRNWKRRPHWRGEPQDSDERKKVAVREQLVNTRVMGFPSLPGAFDSNKSMIPGRRIAGGKSYMEALGAGVSRVEGVKFTGSGNL